MQVIPDPCSHDCMQLQVRKIKRRACEYDYVEIMACPGGCLNGGGQFAAMPGKSPTQLLDRLDTIYHDPEVPTWHLSFSTLRS